MNLTLLARFLVALADRKFEVFTEHLNALSERSS